MSEETIAALYRARSSSRSCDRWGRALTLLLVVCALSSIVVGLDLATYLLLVVAFLIAAIGLIKPGIGLMGIALLATTEAVLRQTAFAGGMVLPFNTVNYWLVLFCLLHVKRILHVRPLQGKLHLLLAVVLAVGLFWAPSINANGLTQLLRVTAAFGLILYFEVCPPSQYRMLLWVAIAASAVATILGLVIFQNPSLAMRFNANDLAMLPLTGLFTVFLATFAKVAKRREMDVLILLGAANLTFIFLSGSRGAIFPALFLWLATLVGHFNVPQKIGYGVATAVVVVGLAVLSPQFQDFAIQRLELTFDSSRTLSQRTSGRLDIARVGWSIFLQKPFGVGTGGFRDAMDRFYEPGVRFWGFGKSAESAWVQVLTENGVIGIAVLLAYVASFAWTGLQRRDRDLIMVGLIASGTLALRFVTAEFEMIGVWWLAAGSVFLLHRKSRSLQQSLLLELQHADQFSDARGSLQPSPSARASRHRLA